MPMDNGADVAHGVKDAHRQRSRCLLRGLRYPGMTIPTKDKRVYENSI